MITQVHRYDNIADPGQTCPASEKGKYLTKANVGEEFSFATSGLPHSTPRQHHVREAQHLEPIITSPMKVMRPAPCPTGLQSAPFQSRQTAIFSTGEKQFSITVIIFPSLQFNM